MAGMYKSSLSLAAIASCEPHRISAYSEDLRWRMVWRCEALGCMHARVDENLGVGRSTVSRTLQLFYTTGSICKKLYPKEKAFRKLTTPAQLLILNLVVMKPSRYLQEIQDELQNVLVDISTICRFLLNNGLTRQKLCLVATQRVELIHQQDILDASAYKPEMLVFLDETCADQRNVLRKYGYSLCGIPPKHNTLLVRGGRMSELAVIGLLDVSFVKGTTDGDTFYDFVQK